MPTIAIIGGSGPEGRGLGLRFAMAGHRVIIGSRDAPRAAQAAQGLLQARPGLPITGAPNPQAARDADWVVISVPYEAMASTVELLAPQVVRKLVVSVVVPLTFASKHPAPVAVPEGSAAQRMASLLPESQVVAAFHHISAHDLLVPDRRLEADVIVCSDHAEAKRMVMELTGQVASLRAIDGGPLENARYVEELTVLLLHINRRYKGHSMVRLVGI